MLERITFTTNPATTKWKETSFGRPRPRHPTSRGSLLNTSFQQGVGAVKRVFQRRRDSWKGFQGEEEEDSYPIEGNQKLVRAIPV